MTQAFRTSHAVCGANTNAPPPPRARRLGAGLVGLAALAAALGGCGDSGLHARVVDAIGRVDAAVAQLGKELDSGSLRNAALIKQYAAKVIDSKPELRDLARVLEREGTRRGTLYAGLAERAKALREGLPEPGAPQQAYLSVAEELDALAAAAQPSEFNRALADPLNVLADLTDGALPRVDATSAGTSRRANNAADFGAGSQLVGNPNYGRWRTDSSGTSFWVWYGQFALIRDLLGGPRIGYGDWAGRRDYSYYHDYGRRNYTSPGARSRQTQVETSAKRKFASQGRTFRSPYERRRQGASTSVARQKFASAGSRPSSAAGGSATRRFASSSATRSRPASMRGFGGLRGPRRGK